MKLKTLAAAAALAASGANPALAITQGDNAPFDADGDVVFQLLDTATGTTLAWDLSGVLGTSGGDMTTAEFTGNPLGGPIAITSFSLTNTALDTFMASINLATMKWRVLGASQIAPTTSDLPSLNYGALLTSTSAPNPAALTAFGIGSRVAAVNSLVNGLGNLEGLDNDAQEVAAGSIANWNAILETDLTTNNPKTGLGVIDFYYIHRDPTIPGNVGAFFASGSVLASALGTIELAWDGDSATLCFNQGSCGVVSAVPVPAAAWLFGSALLGLAGIARRQQVG